MLILVVFLMLHFLSVHAMNAQQTKNVEIENGVLKVSFDAQSKRWSLFEKEKARWRPVVEAMSASVVLQSGDTVHVHKEEVTARTGPISNSIGRGTALELEVRASRLDLLLRISLYEGIKVASVDGSIRNRSRDSLGVKELLLLDGLDHGSLPTDDEHPLVLINGYQSWSGCEVAKLEGPTAVTSYWNAVVYESSHRRALLLGFVTNAQATNSFQFIPSSEHRNPVRFKASSELRTVRVLPNSQFRSDQLVLLLEDSPLSALEWYAAHIGEAEHVGRQVSETTPSRQSRDRAAFLGSTPVRQQVPAGWCSWYYYFEKVTEDEVIANLDFAAEHFANLGFRYIQIDDGYQVAAGDWETNEKFPHGHSWLTDQIHRQGLLAGLWVAPFAIAESSSVYRRHPGWLLKNADGSLRQFFANDWWGGGIYGLDPTIPEVQEWLRELFQKVTRQWGYDYVKIDFLHFAAEGGQYHLPTSPAQAYQMGLRAIREGVGDDRFILGCGAPLGGSAGYVDGMRIGTDVYAAWGGITPGVHAAAHRYFYHNNVWFNDPDCMLVREPLTLEQACVWASIIALSGQMNLFSDKLTELPEDRVELLKKTIPVYGTSAVPVDLFEAPEEEGLTLLSADRTARQTRPDGMVARASHRLSGPWKFQPGDDRQWSSPLFNDADWKEIAVPARWENIGYPDLEGFVWYRTRFTLPRDFPRGDLKFFFAKVDDCDQTYLNGQLIGAMGSMPPEYSTEWTSFRIYAIPQHVLNWDGENVLAVRVYDGGGAGGIYSIRQSRLPKLWNLEVRKTFGRWNVLGVYNWERDSSRIVVSLEDLRLSPAKSYLVYELWGQEFLGEYQKTISLDVKPTSCLILSIHERPDFPIVLSTSRHITQGAIDLKNLEWDQKTFSLRGESINLGVDRYDVVLYIPKGFRYGRVVSPVESGFVQVNERTGIVTFKTRGSPSLNWKVVFDPAE